jgi:large subunit ribosomal protein L28
MLSRNFSTMLSSSALRQRVVVRAAAIPQLSHLPTLNDTQDIGGCRYRSNRSRRGLYDGKDIRAGNNVSFSMRATKRTFKPNVFLKRVYSETLDEMMRFHLTTSALRSIDKAGGLDNYLLTSKHVTSGEGHEAKKLILKKMKDNERKSAASVGEKMEASATEQTLSLEGA